MPIVVAAAVRVVIQVAIQLGLMALWDRLISPILRKAIIEIAKLGGNTEEESDAILTWIMFDQLSYFFGGVVAMKSKLPTRAAEILGFTSRGWKPPVLNARQQTTMRKMGYKGDLGNPIIIGAKQADIEIAASIFKTSTKALSNMLSFLGKGLNTLFLGALVAANVLDFGNWESGAYSQQMQRFFSAVTFGSLKPDAEYRQSKTVSKEVFDKVYESYKLQGALTIKDPRKGYDVEFTRDNMVDLLDWVGAQLLTSQGQVTTKEVIKNTQMLITFGATLPGKTQTRKYIIYLGPGVMEDNVDLNQKWHSQIDFQRLPGGGGEQYTVYVDPAIPLSDIWPSFDTTRGLFFKRPPAGIRPVAVVSGGGGFVGFDAYKYDDGPTVYRTSDNYAFHTGEEFLAAGGDWTRVRTIPRPPVENARIIQGIINNGVVTNAPSFSERPSDLIDSLQGLVQSAKTNVTSYLLALPGRLAYEFKTVPSVVDRDGVRRYGSTQQIIVSHSSKGVPKYKTVTNRFMVCLIYIQGSRGNRIKVDEINLGPVDAGKIVATSKDLGDLSYELQKNLVTSDVRQISQVATPVTTASPVTTALEPSQIDAKLAIFDKAAQDTPNIASRREELVLMLQANPNLNVESEIRTYRAASPVLLTLPNGNRWWSTDIVGRLDRGSTAEQLTSEFGIPIEIINQAVKLHRG